MRKLMLLLAVLVFLAPAISAELEGHSIILSLDKEGNAEVTEEFTISLSTTADIQTFTQIGGMGATTELEAWQVLAPDMHTSLIGDKKGLVITSKRDQLGFGHVTANYNINSFAGNLGEEGRFITLGFTMQDFTFYNINTQLMTLQAGTSIQIELEDVRTTKTEDVSDFISITPRGVFLGPYLQENKVVYLGRGPLVLSEFTVSYRIEKSLSESFSFENLYSFFIYNPAYAILLALLAFLTIVFRKQVFGITGDGSVEEEEIQLPKREL